jgi:hypothetical protein
MGLEVRKRIGKIRERGTLGQHQGAIWTSTILRIELEKSLDGLLGDTGLIIAILRRYYCIFLWPFLSTDAI